MKDLIQTYLIANGVSEDYSISFLKFSTALKLVGGEYELDFPIWRFPFPKPVFSSEEIEECLKDEYFKTHEEGIKNKYPSLTDTIKRYKLISKLKSLSNIEEIRNFTY